MNRLLAPENRLYAHWLDGEWFRIAYPITAEGPLYTLQDHVEGALRLHALFGTRIAISDVQLTDSAFVVRLFANPEFRQFLKKDRTFLTLVAEQRSGISDVRLARATRGLDRAFNQKVWASSLPGISLDVIKRFADPILSAHTLDTAHCVRDKSKGPGFVIERHPAQRELLQGILYGICHFTKQTGGPTDAPAAPPRPYTHFIKEALDSKGPGDACGAAENIWQAIEDLVPDEGKRFARTSVVTALEAKQPDRNKWSPESHKIWNTVVHAWNSNVCDTLGSKRASIIPLPGADLLFRGRVTDVAGPFHPDEGLLRPNISKRFPLFYSHPAAIGWLDVLEAFKKTEEKRRAFQTALADRAPQAAAEAGTALANDLSAALAPTQRTFIPEWIWIPLDLAGLYYNVPVAEAHSADSSIALVRTEVRRRKVLNTLHGFKDSLITALKGTE